jgi:hypothetical protein
MWYRTYTSGLGYEFVAYNVNGSVSAAPGWGAASTAAELGYIPPMQAFWVRLQDGVVAGNFTFDYASVASSGRGNRLRSEEVSAAEPVIDVLVRLDVADVALTDADQLVIYSTPDAQSVFDNFDSEKMTDGSDLVRLYTYTANAEETALAQSPQTIGENLNKVQNLVKVGETTAKALCIDGRKSIKVGDVIPLVFRASWATPFMIRASELRGCGDIAVYLVDKLANKEFKLNGGGIYYFTSPSGELKDRFALEFRQAPVANETVAGNESFFAWSNAPGTISVSGVACDKVEVYDLVGRVVATLIPNAKNRESQSREGDDSLSFAPIAIENIKPGVYIVRCGETSVKVAVND